MNALEWFLACLCLGFLALAFVYSTLNVFAVLSRAESDHEEFDPQ